METVIFEFIVAIFKCVQDHKDPVSPAQAVKDELNEPNWRHYRAILRVLRDKEDLHGRDLREAADDVFSMLREADAEDIDDLVDDAVALGMEGGR